MATFDMVEAAAQLCVSRRWLQGFLSTNPTDAAGVPFYVPLGNRKKFTDQDIARILKFSRDAEQQRLSEMRRPRISRRATKFNPQPAPDMWAEARKQFPRLDEFMVKAAKTNRRKHP